MATEKRGIFKVKGNKVLVFGDLHLSSSYEGQHKNYILDCYKNMEIILNIVKTEKPTAVFFLGDLIGVKETKISDRQFLMRVMQFFEMLNSLTKKNVYSVKGNHDISDFSDFDFLLGMGLIKNPRYVDFYSNQNTFEVRFHFVNYGEEHNDLKLTNEEECASNVVLGHAEYYIDGVTNWYSARKGIEVSQLGNFCGVDFILSGHIHTPSEEMLNTTLKDSSSIGLFFVGSPSRTAERFDDCFYFLFETNTDENTNLTCTDYRAELMGLPKVSEVFYPEENFINNENVDERLERSQILTDIVSEVIEGRITSGDLFKQIDVLPESAASSRVKNIAKDYLKKAMEVK